MVSIALNSLKWIDGVGVYVDVSPGDCGSIDVEFVRNGQMYCATRPKHRVIELERFIESHGVKQSAKDYARKRLDVVKQDVDLMLADMQDTATYSIPELLLMACGFACVVFLSVIWIAVRVSG